MKETPHFETTYGSVAHHVLKCASNIRLLICDVDGVMSDGLIYMGNNGEEIKSFNVRDNYGIRYLLTAGVEVALITGSSARMLEEHCVNLGITHLYQGQSDKTLAFKTLLSKLTLTAEQIAYVGDDLIDAPVMEQVGLSVAVADAHPLLQLSADYVTRMAGGHGAVREVCDLLLFAQGKHEDTKV